MRDEAEHEGDSEAGGIGTGRSRDAAGVSAFVLREANVLDESGGFGGPLDVHVADGRVVAVGENLPAGDATALDFSGLWVLPGIFDCHDHVALSSIDGYECLRRPLSEWVLEAAHQARRTLEAGVTFVRDCGGADAGMRDAIARGYVPGPTLFVSIVLISPTGGHGDGFLAGPGFEMSSGYLMPDWPGKPPYLVDGADSMRHAVRAALRSGADFIKLATTGGLVSDHDQPLISEFTVEEIEAAVQEAARKGKHVASHAYGGEGLDNAVRAGVRSIEHGGFLTEEQAARMAEAGCWLVPTLSAMRDTLTWAEQGRLTPPQCEKVLGFGLELGGAVRLAKEYGVKMASGTDYIMREQHGNNLEELLLMRQAGLSVEETLLTATIRGAELCGVDGVYGRVAPGYVFDAIVLDADPGDLSAFASPGAVTGVFKAGEPVVVHERVREAGLVGAR
jgi:imidazolonepropionase-like amidohydrolase